MDVLGFDLVVFLCAIDLFCNIKFTFECLIGIGSGIATMLLTSVDEFQVVSNTM